jgi:hypothetical protein
MIKKYFAVLFLLFSLPLVAQPEFTEADLPAIGYNAEFVSDTASEIIVDVGKPGGPRTWDFSKPVTGDTALFEVLTPAGTVWDTFFPKAECVYHTTGVGNDSLSGDMWQYLRTTAIQMRLLGVTFNIDTLALMGKCDPEQTFLPLPLKMGSQWSDSLFLMDTISMDPAPVVITYHEYKTSLVDAWGTITVPKGTYEALRLLVHDTVFVNVMLGPIPFMADTSMTINYQWLASAVGPVMSIASRDGEGDPEFDTASGYAPLVKNNINTSIEDKPQAKPGDALVFEEGKVFFEADGKSYIDLTLYDAVGRTIGMLYGATPQAGRQSVELPRRLPKGVYFVRLRAPEKSSCGKIVIIE